MPICKTCKYADSLESINEEKAYFCKKRLSLMPITPFYANECCPNTCPLLELELELADYLTQSAVKQMIPHRSISDHTLLALMAELEKETKQNGSNNNT